jgi:aminoglycoside N3'-acetyltransferase
MSNLIKKHFEKLNIKIGDKIVIYPKISSFGISRKDFAKDLLRSIKEYIGINGTIIMPSYTFEKNKKFIFNPKILKKNYSTSPLVQEFFKNKQIERSIRPIHSHLGVGKEIKFLQNKNNFDSFGKLSDFNFFLKHNFKSVFLGSTPNDAATYLIHLEYLMKVPYRKKIKIKKKIKLKNKIISPEINYFDRPKSFEFDYDQAFSKMIKLGLKVKKSKLKFGYSLSFFYKDLDFYAKKLFKMNKYCLVKNNK